PLATSWHSNKFLNAATDGAVLPILHLHGYKIANPTVLARIPERELVALFEGYGWRPLIVTSELDEPPPDAHQRSAAALDPAPGRPSFAARPSRCPSRGAGRGRRRARSGAACARSSRGTRGRSGSSARTRRRQTASRTSSPRPPARGAPRSSRRTRTSPPTG